MLLVVSLSLVSEEAASFKFQTELNSLCTCHHRMLTQFTTEPYFVLVELPGAVCKLFQTVCYFHFSPEISWSESYN